MLVLTRTPHERITIGNDIVIEILGSRGQQVKVGVIAPADVSVDREEIGWEKQGRLLTRSSAVPDAESFSIVETGLLVGVKPITLLKWRESFPIVRPQRRKQTYYYCRNDVLVLRQIYDLVYKQGLSDEQINKQLQALSH